MNRKFFSIGVVLEVCFGDKVVVVDQIGDVFDVVCFQLFEHLLFVLV
jgi:hypothetical protein